MRRMESIRFADMAVTPPGKNLGGAIKLSGLMRV